MKIKSILNHKLYDHGHIEINYPLEDAAEIEDKLTALGSIDDKTDYELVIRKKRYKRSNNANSYLWVLADKIAYVTKQTKEEVYREMIRRVGVFQDVAIKKEAVGALVKSWSERGIGWFCDTFDSRLDGWKRVRLYYGSHTYDTKQMSRLIDETIEEAKSLNIETMTPNEIARMKQEWSVM